MKTRALSIFFALFLPSLAFASPPWSLEGLLTRAKFVFVGKVTAIEGERVSLEVISWERGKGEKESFAFRLAGLADRKPEKGELYFVFSQGHDSFGEPKDEVQTSHGLEGQRGYTGWIMLRIVKKADVEQIENAYSFVLTKSVEDAFKTPVTLQQAKQLAKEGRFKEERKP